MKLNYITSAVAFSLLLSPIGLKAEKFGDVLADIVKDAATHYQNPPHYANGGGYYPYTPPPAKADPTTRNQHAFDVGYRVGQDDFHHHLSKHFTRHSKLYDHDTHDAFARGYGSGYDIARAQASGTNRPYPQPSVPSGHIKSSLYPSGYYPYAPAPRDAHPSTKQRHAYDIGFRVGQDDFYGGHSKHFTRHPDLYDKGTHDDFAMGYGHGYDKARAHAREAGGSKPAHASGLRASVGQGAITVRDGGRVVSTVHTAMPNIESYHFTNGNRQIVVKSRGNHGPATVELFDVRTGALRDKVLAFAIKGGRPEWARGMED